MNATYERLTALDSSFLLLEKPHTPLHVASVMICEAGLLRTADGGIDAARIQAHVLAELHRIPRYRQKISWVPLSWRPVWIDDESFHLDYHIRHTSLPRPGSDAQLKRLAARIMEQPLDPFRPLWEMWIVEGLEGDRFATISKAHHCMIDGISGVDLMRILLGPTPETGTAEPARWLPRAAPAGFRLWLDEMTRRATLPLRLVDGLRALADEATEARREVVSRVRAAVELVAGSLQIAPSTPLNQPVGARRRFDWLDMDLSRLRTLRRTLGGSLNDVVLTIVTGAVQRFLERRHVNPAGVPFRVMAPVSVRASNQRGALGNQVSAWLIDLPLDEVDPRAQLRRISARTAELKNSGQAVGARVLTEMAEWSSSTLLALGARNVSRLLPFNMIVTNVPGPQFPIYMQGARLLQAFPLVPLVDNLGLGIALMSYDGRLCWGFNADYDLVPDLAAFVRGIEESFEDLERLAAPPANLAPHAVASLHVARGAGI